MHEIVTLQFGPSSNALATHFWNTQDSYLVYDPSASESPVDPDVLFRPGIAPDGSDTFTPRTVVYDFKSAFGTMRREGALWSAVHEDGADPGTWGRRTVRQTQPSIPQTAYQHALDLGLAPPPLTLHDIRYWSDYARTFYHPRSIVQISSMDVSPAMRAFDDWSTGAELFGTLDREHDLLDRDLRPFVEECDALQGLQVLVDTGSAWGAFGGRYLERMRDELGKVEVWAWAVGGPEGDAGPRKTALNEARAAWELAPQSDVYVPLTVEAERLPNDVQVLGREFWHVSALQATGFESVTLPSRLRDLGGVNGATFGHLGQLLNQPGNRKIARLKYNVWPKEDDMRADGDINLYPAGQNDASAVEEQVFAEVQTLRGRSSDLDTNGHSLPDSVFRRFSTPLTYPILDSFPSIFASITPQKSLAVRASLLSSSSIGPWLRSLAANASRRIGLDEREDFMSGMHDMSEAYNENRDSDSGDDWED